MEDFETYYRAAEEEAKKAPTFLQELTSLINRHSMENDSDTPDFILAEYLLNCLNTYNQAVNTRDLWYTSADEPLDGDDPHECRADAEPECCGKCENPKPYVEPKINYLDDPTSLLKYTKIPD
jgi:hypothetical protein